MPAAEIGKGYMSYSTAMARLRAALVPAPTSGQKPAVGALFEQIFR